MPLLIPSILTLASLITATISGIIGMGGGILLLAIMFCFLPFDQAIPLHAAVQFVTHITRILAFFRHVDWKTVRRYLLGALPGCALAGLILWSLGEPGRAEPWLKIAIGLYILAATFLPHTQSLNGLPPPARAAGVPGGPAREPPNAPTSHDDEPPRVERPPRVTNVSPARRYDFTLLGLVTGTAALTVGAVGPLIAPLFARRGFVKQRLIATKAVCGMGTHALKIVAFSLLGTIEFTRFSALLAAMWVAVILGTFLGKRILTQVSERGFVRLYRLALTVAGLKVLLIDGLWRAPAPLLLTPHP